jgi:hypothetical protein
MEHSQKVTVMPLESEMQPPVLPMVTDSNVQFSSQEKKPKSSAHPLLEKLTKQIKIILKLAKVNGYDADLRIRGEGENFINNSNIINLLADATSASKVLIGYNEFIRLLYEANVEPELIINENVKYQLIKMYEGQPKRGFTQMYTRTSPAVFREPDKAEPVIRTNTKRARSPEIIQEEGVETVEPPTKKRLNWILPASDIPLPLDADDDF